MKIDVMMMLIISILYYENIFYTLDFEKYFYSFLLYYYKNNSVWIFPYGKGVKISILMLIFSDIFGYTL
jgi:hypothetical protein